MGRYAFFNTGFEYKFGFGAQSSRDILLFSGLGNSYGFITSPYFKGTPQDPYHEWSQNDKPIILRRLQTIVEDLDDCVIDFERFEKNIHGTQKLREAIREQNEDNDEVFYLYLLGCLIYHQLLYTEKLTATYEV